MAARRQALGLHLQALDRGIDVAHRAAGRRSPRPARARARAPGGFPARRRRARRGRRRESGIRAAPRTIPDRRRSRRRPRSASTPRKSSQTKCGSMKRSCRRCPSAPARPRCGSRQNQAISARSSNCWARLMRASGGISKERNSTRPSRPVGAVGRIELVDADFGAMGVAGDVDEQVAEQPVDEPERRAPRRAAGSGERDLQFVELVVARLVEPRRLAGRADEQAGEQIGQRGMALPVEDEARRAGRAGAGTANPPASAPPSTTWLPPPVPVWRPSVMNLSVPSRAWRASS